MVMLGGLLAKALLVPVLGPVLGFFGRYWRIIVPVIAVIALYFVVSRYLGGVDQRGYDRGYAERGRICENARLAAEAAVIAEHAAIVMQGQLDREAMEADLSQRQAAREADLARDIADLRGIVGRLRAAPRPTAPGSPVPVVFCELDPTALNDLRENLNGSRGVRP